MESKGFHISFEKIVLIAVLMFVWLSVLMMEKWMPHQSAAIFILCLMVTYGLLISIANHHHRRKLAKGEVVLPDLSDYHPSVSIIVPAHNEAAVIADTVKNLMAIDYDRYDLWIFDDRSSDGTAAVLEELAQHYPGRFHFVVRPASATPGKSAVLNEAIEKTDSDILVVFDADGRVQPDFLKKALPYLFEPGVGAVQVQKKIVNADINLLARCQHHEYLLDAHVQAGRDIIRAAVELRGNGQLTKRLALQSVEGWTEDTITDDLDLSTKLHLAGWDIRFTTDTYVEEEGILSFKPLLRQRRRWAEGNLRRYLDYGINIFTSPHVSYRVTLDMLAYFIKFLFPIWIASDLFLQVINLFLGELPTHLISSLIMFPAVCIFFISGLFVTLRERAHAGFWQAFIHAVETGIYMMVVWAPVVMWITAKVLFTKDEGPLNWGKTEHLGIQAHVKVSRLQRIKSLLNRS